MRSAFSIKRAFVPCTDKQSDHSKPERKWVARRPVTLAPAGSTVGGYGVTVFVDLGGIPSSWRH